MTPTARSGERSQYAAVTAAMIAKVALASLAIFLAFGVFILFIVTFNGIDDTSGCADNKKLHRLQTSPRMEARWGLWGQLARLGARAGAGALAEACEVTRRIAALRNYRWSSYRAYIGLQSCPPWLDSQPVLDGAGSTEN
jgi:hypothetical protein